MKDLGILMAFFLLTSKEFVPMLKIGTDIKDLENTPTWTYADTLEATDNTQLPLIPGYTGDIQALDYIELKTFLHKIAGCKYLNY